MLKEDINPDTTGKDGQYDSSQNSAQFNAEEQEQAVDEKQSDESRNENINQQSLTTQGDEAELEENLGGTTNLTLDQLKKEGDPGHSTV